MEETGRMFTLNIPNSSIGVGSINTVAAIVKGLGGTKALIITDPGVVSAGLIDGVKQSLDKGGVEYNIFDKCQPDAPLVVIEECAKELKKGSYTVTIGIGGGSTMDSTKFASVLAGTDKDAQSLIGIEKAEKPGLPKVLIPTTAGTGSEWSPFCIVTDRDGGKKLLRSKYAMGNEIIIDPAITMNLPPRITADTGMDAFCHAVEAYITWKANIVSDMLAEKGIQLVSRNLRLAYAKGNKHVEARYNMAIAAAIGMAAMSCSGGGLAHAMNYGFAVKAHISHGSALCILLPAVMEYNLIGNRAKFVRMAELMGENVNGLSELEAAQKAIQAIRQLNIDLGMPQRMRDVGIKKEDIPGMIDFLFKVYGVAMDVNCRDITPENATRIYEACW